jgi:hypothetical protein
VRKKGFEVFGGRCKSVGGWWQRKSWRSRDSLTSCEKRDTLIESAPFQK